MVSGESVETSPLYYISWKENSLFEPCSSLFEDLCSNGCSKGLVRILVRCPCSKPCSRTESENTRSLFDACTRACTSLVRSLYEHFSARGPLRPCGSCAALYQLVVRSLAKGLVQGVVRSASEQPLNKRIPLRR